MIIKVADSKNHLTRAIFATDKQIIMPELNSHNKEEFPPMHTAEHILNQTMIRLFSCGRAINAHIEHKKSKCDYLIDHALTPNEVKAVEDAVNSVIDSAIDVTEEFVSIEGASRFLDLRKLPAGVSQTIRVIRVGDYDACACIGAHVRNTREIGRFSIISTDYNSGTVRIRFKVN